MSFYSKDNQGFTIIELIVSITIITVILTVVALGHSKYSDGVSLLNVVDKISISLSQAQSYGLGVRELSPGLGDFKASYGYTFSLLSGNSGSNRAYLSFADRNADKTYNGNWTCPVGGASECLEKINITGGNYIISLCVLRTSGANLCVIDRVDISFSRPNTEAQIVFFNNGGQPYNPANIKGAEIGVRSPGGSTKYVSIFKTGQISVQ